MKPHKHAEVIKAWADGAEIEIRMEERWYTAHSPTWDISGIYRIKPEVKPDVIVVGIVEIPDDMKPEQRNSRC